MQTSEGATGFLGETAQLASLLESYRSLAAAPSPSAPLVAREIDAYKHLKAHLSRLSQQLAHNGLQRQGFLDSGLFSALLEYLSALYFVFEQIQDARPPPQEAERDGPETSSSSVHDKEEQPDPYYRVSQIAMLVIRVLRNGLAGCVDAQSHLCHRFDLISPFLSNITRFHVLNDPDTLLLSRSAIQMLSNLITSNRDVQHRMWSRIVTPDRDEDKLVLKFLSSPDTATQSAAQILLINFLRTPAWSDDAHSRCHELCTTSAGLQLIQSLLSSSESIMLRTASAAQDISSQEYEPEAEIQGLEESLGFIYTIFAILFEGGFSSMLIAALAPIEEISTQSPSSMQSDLPVISSSQLTLLKLLDSWLHLNQKEAAEASSSASSLDGGGRTMAAGLAAKDAGLAGLVDIFMQLSAFAREAMSGGIAKDGVPADQQPQDRRLIGVHHSLLLLLQSLLSISLAADGWSDERSLLDGPSGQSEHSFASLSRALLSDMRRNVAFVDELVALLDQTHQYAPALSPFRPTNAGGSSGSVPAEANGDLGSRPLPQGHALSSTGKAAIEGKDKQTGYGFDHLKRDIVRVMGSLVYTPTSSVTGASKQPAEEAAAGLGRAHEASKEADAIIYNKAQIRQVQDRIREQGGLFHVLNMTVLDERNPCKSLSDASMRQMRSRRSGLHADSPFRIIAV